MNKTKAVKYIFGVLFLSVSIYSLMNYIDFRNALTKSKPIVYSFIEKRVNKGGRGESYDMIIKFKNKERTISITSKEFELIENGKYPELFYSNDTDSIFSKWSIKLSLRITILFLLLSIVAILPWNKLVKQRASN